MLPLRARDGSVRAWTRVDAADAPMLAQWRWSLHSNGYVYRLETVDGRKHAVRLHRLLLGLSRGDDRQADHVNRDRLDNRRANLRVVTGAENKQNVRARGGTSRFRGVALHRPGRWIARFGRVYLGVFTTEEEAAAAAARYRAQYLPFSEDAALAA